MDNYILIIGLLIIAAGILFVASIPLWTIKEDEKEALKETK